MRRTGMVVVAMNYRLAALGFLYLADLGGPAWEGAANCGSLDQIAALRWVRDNIAGFGGDPASVTVFGESAGGFAIGGLLGMPAAAGLFDRAILQSGSSSRVYDRDLATAMARDTLAGLGLSHPDQLVDVPAERILAAQLQVIDSDIGRRNSPGGRAWGSVIDGVSLPDHPLRAVAGGSAAGTPLVVGATTEEIALWVVAEGEAFAPAGEEELRAEMAGCVGPDVAAGLFDAYRGRATPDLTAIRAAFLTDWVFRVPAIRLAEAQVAAGGAVWAYLFGWRSPAFDGRLGAHHGVELPFVFDRLGEVGLAGAVTPDDPTTRAVRDDLIGAWAAFGRDGDPGWPRYRLDDRLARVFGAEPALTREPPADTVALWAQANTGPLWPQAQAGARSTPVGADRPTG
jgi:para-nitrobenzyl esterase